MGEKELGIIHSYEQLSGVLFPSLYYHFSPNFGLYM
jgi:hypothetical protein